MKQAFIVGDATKYVFLSKGGMVGEQYLDDMAIFFSQKAAKEAAEKYSGAIKLLVWEVSLTLAI